MTERKKSVWSHFSSSDFLVRCSFFSNYNDQSCATGTIERFWPNLIFRILVYPHLRRSAESSSAGRLCLFRRISLHYIARWLIMTVTGLFSFLQALQRKSKKRRIYHEQRNHYHRRRALLRWPSPKLQRLLLLEKPQSRLLSQKGKLLLPGRVAQTHFPLCGLLLRPLCEFLYEEMYERGLWDPDGGDEECVKQKTWTSTETSWNTRSPWIGTKRLPDAGTAAKVLPRS